EAVATMNRIAEEVESDPTYRTIIQAQRAEPEATGADAISAAARQIAETLKLSAVGGWTSSRATALRVARERPETQIIAISPKVSTGRKLALVWGVHCVVAEDARDQDDMVDRACRLAFRDGFAKAGQRVIVVAGVPLGTPGATNMLRVAFVGTESAGDLYRIGRARAASCCHEICQRICPIRIKSAGMKVGGKHTRTIWLEADGATVGVIDQTQLPHRFATLRLASLDDAARAIKTMQIRGAPLIGATAAYGVALALNADA